MCVCVCVCVCLCVCACVRACVRVCVFCACVLRCACACARACMYVQNLIADLTKFLYSRSGLEFQHKSADAVTRLHSKSLVSYTGNIHTLVKRTLFLPTSYGNAWYACLQKSYVTRLCCFLLLAVSVRALCRQKIYV